MRYNYHYRKRERRFFMNYNVYESLGKRLWECREKLKLSREAFAGKCDISPQFLAEIEHGRKGISVETLYKICTAFSISADYLVFGKPNMNLGSPANCLLDGVSNEDMEEYMTIISMINTLVKKNEE